jgi:hypothetical protein
VARVDPERLALRSCGADHEVVASEPGLASRGFGASFASLKPSGGAPIGLLMDTRDSFWAHWDQIFHAARRFPAGEERQDAIQDGWLSVVARGDSTRVAASMRAGRRYRKRGGMTNRADALSPGVSDAMSTGRHPDADQWLKTNAGGWGVVVPPHLAAGDHKPTGNAPGRPSRKAPNGAGARLLKAAGIEPLPNGMSELRSLVNAGRRGRDPRLVRAVVECQELGASELARLLGCSRQSINAILRDHRDV